MFAIKASPFHKVGKAYEIEGTDTFHQIYTTQPDPILESIKEIDFMSTTHKIEKKNEASRIKKIIKTHEIKSLKEASSNQCDSKDDFFF